MSEHHLIRLQVISRIMRASADEGVLPVFGCSPYAKSATRLRQPGAHGFGRSSISRRLLNSPTADQGQSKVCASENTIAVSS